MLGLRAPALQRADGVGRACVLDLVGRDACLHARQHERASRRTRHRQPVFRRRHARFLPRLAGGQEHEFRQTQHVGETPREREVAVVDRIEGAAEQTDPARQRDRMSVRIQVRVLS